MVDQETRSKRSKRKRVAFEEDLSRENLTPDPGDQVPASHTEDRSDPLTTEVDLKRADVSSKKRARADRPNPPNAISWEKSDLSRDDVLADDPITKIDPRLPKPPFRWGMFAAMGGGKTSLISTLLKNGPDTGVPGFKGVFDEVHIFSPNILKDSSWKWLRDSGFPASRMHTTFSRQELEEMQRGWDRERLEQIYKYNVPFGSAKRVLVVFDDFINLKPDRPMAFQDDSIVDSRHGGLSIIISGQRYNKVNPVTRNNLSHISFWPKGSAADRDLVINDQGLVEGTTPSAIRKQFERVQEFSKPHDMVFIDKTKPPGEQLTHGIGGPLLSEGDAFSFRDKEPT